jgi:hypothetical protein
MRIGTAAKRPDRGGPIAVKGQEDRAASASPRLGAPLGRFPSAPSDFPTPPLFATAEPGPAELAGGIDVLGSEAFASHLSKAAALDSRPPELTLDPDLDPSAALLLRVGPTTNLRLDLSPSRIAGREGEGSTRSPIAGREGEGSTPSTQDRGGPIAVKGQEAQSGDAVVPKATKTFTALTASTAIHTSKDLAGHSRPPLLSSDLRPTASPDAIARREGESDSHKEGSTPSEPRTSRGALAVSGAMVTRATKAFTATNTLKDSASDSRPPVDLAPTSRSAAAGSPAACRSQAPSASRSDAEGGELGAGRAPRTSECGWRN